MPYTYTQATWEWLAAAAEQSSSILLRSDIYTYEMQMALALNFIAIEKGAD